MNARIQRLIAGVAVPVILAGSVSCGKVARSGRSSSFLVIDTLTASSGADPGSFTGVLNSDVVTLVKVTVAGVETQVPTIFDDPAKVSLRTLLKNPGEPGTASQPSALNAVTVDRYRVVFVRADGHNVQGVDVPYAFDGAATATVSGAVEIGFELVRHSAKTEAPLKALAGGGGQKFVSTIAQVTFYGHDQAGNEVEVTGNISVNFADFGDPA